MARRPTKRPGLILIVHSLRVGQIGMLLLLIPAPRVSTAPGSFTAPAVDRIQRILPAAHSVDDSHDELSLWGVRDEIGKVIGYVARTLPSDKAVIGYRGPTESAIVLDTEMRIAGIWLLQSDDTPEYVAAVRNDANFIGQFKGWSWGGPDPMTEIDGVSGATLTSLACAKSIVQRIGGNRPSLLFPDPITTGEVRDWFPNAHWIDDGQVVAIVNDARGNQVGRVLRTGPLCDDVTGYRGPTELLLKLDAHDRVDAIKVRASYDNEPFTGWVQEDREFWANFGGRTLNQLAKLNPEAEGVDGVTDATMTSMAAADTLIAAAGQASADRTIARQAAVDHSGLWAAQWSKTDFATVLILALAAMASQSHWFGNRVFRKSWLVTVVIVIGLWAGHLVSLTLIAGWAAAGIAWQIAPGLSAITLVAMAMPPIGGGNPYCHHLCPHGAIQQLVKPSRQARRHVHLSPRLTVWLKFIPGISLVAAYATLIVVPQVDLSAWEPFNAYLFRIAPWGAIAMALASLAFAGMVPMGYCRFGCPTGSLLGYLRRSAMSDRWQGADWIAFALLIFAATLTFRAGALAA